MSQNAKKPSMLFPKKGNPAVRVGPVAFRLHLTMGLALKRYLKKLEKIKHIRLTNYLGLNAKSIT